MLKRMLDLNTSELENMSKKEKLSNIRAAEGRTLMTEVISSAPPLLYDVSNVELACGFGADMILLNFYDVNDPEVLGLPIQKGMNIVQQIKHLTGRMLGINLEPVDSNIPIIDEKVHLPEGRTATIENVRKAIFQGVDFIVLTGNPKTGVTNHQIAKQIRKIKGAIEDEIIIIAGKMHAAGTVGEMGREIINKDITQTFIEAGADIILLPAPGTVPGMTVEYVKEIVDFVHRKGCMAMTAIGTSQEGADEETIKNIALYSKMTGTDIHHIGDSGIAIGVATPENIMAYSIAIKGKRHTYRRMVRSVNR